MHYILQHTTPEDTWALAMGKRPLIPGYQDLNEISSFDGQKVGQDLEEKKKQISEAAKALKAVKKFADTVKQVFGKIGLGGVKQDRFIARTQEVFKAFTAAGYNNGRNGENIDYRDYRIGKSHVDDKKTKGNYSAEFERLRQYIIRRLNIYNPGLGDLYKSYFPELPMANLGNIYSEPITALKTLLNAFPPGMYTEEIAGKGLTLSEIQAGRDEVEAETREATMKQTVTYFTLGLAAVILVIAVAWKSKKRLDF